jgi:hypothetical protein
MNAHSIRVLDSSDKVAEVRTRPIAPNSAERVVAALPKRSGAFENFVLPLLPKVPDSPSSASTASGSSVAGTLLTGTEGDSAMEDVSKNPNKPLGKQRRTKP